MKVIGIDPAPVKPAVIYNGKEFIAKKPDELKCYIDGLSNGTLICWDAPLTGVPTNLSGLGFNPFYQRKIEHRINNHVECKPPIGISTLGYAGCSHWAITQYCLGLPQIYEKHKCYDTPFNHITENEKKPNKNDKGKYVVEVHPALALWLWLRAESDIVDWKYKDGKYSGDNDSNMFVEKILNICKQNNKPDVSVFKNDDHLDAYIAWLLGSLWLKQLDGYEKYEVKLIGNKETGAMLLPYKNEDNNWTKQLEGKLLDIK